MWSISLDLLSDFFLVSFHWIRFGWSFFSEGGISLDEFVLGWWHFTGLDVGGFLKPDFTKGEIGHQKCARKDQLQWFDGLWLTRV